MTVVAPQYDPWAIALDLIDPPTRDVSPLEADWRVWLQRLIPKYIKADFAPHQVRLWEWVWGLELGVQPEHDAFVAVWPRGGSKSVSAEAACAAVGATGRRRYALYVSRTQDQANDHVAEGVRDMLEGEPMSREYPRMASRLLTKYGHSRGWRRSRVRTASGFTVDAIGLDTAARGVRMEEDRPDFIILDDIDDVEDSPAATEKLIRQITLKLLPAGTNDVAVLAIQNLVHDKGVFARLANVAEGVPQADFLARRIVSGPIPALKDAVIVADPERADPERGLSAYRVVSGTPSWEGQDLAACQQFIDRWGLSGFEREAQHETEPPPGGMFDHLDFAHCTHAQVPQLVRVVVWVDPAVTDNDDSDSQGIQCDGLGVDGRVYRLFSWEQRTSPVKALTKAVEIAIQYQAEKVGVETDQGGDTWESVYREACTAAVEAMSAGERKRVGYMPAFDSDKAGAGHGPKTHRAALMLADYERGRFVHVEGTHLVLERALRRFPKSKPFDCVDSAYYSWSDLVGGLHPVEGRAERTGLRGGR